jgi:hypothetical protein
MGAGAAYARPQRFVARMEDCYGGKRQPSTSLPIVDVSAYQHTVIVTIAASPESIYDLVADIPRMGEWSPVATGGRYDEDRCWFTGTNAIGDYTWETRCRVDRAERGTAFVFVNHGQTGNHEMVRWGFLFDATPEGTRVTESWEVLPTYEQSFAEETDPGMTLEQRLDFMREMARSGMPETLANLKLAAEAG